MGFLNSTGWPHFGIDIARSALNAVGRWMLAFLGNRADVVQWQNISFPS